MREPLAQSQQALQAAWNLYRQGLIADAEQIAHDVLQQQPRSAEVLHLVGTLHLQQGRTADALQALTSALGFAQKSVKKNIALMAEIHNNLGLTLHEQGELAQALIHYQRAIALVPQHADAHYNLHALQIKPNQLQPAIASLKRVLNINPQDSDALIALGMLLDYQGDTSQAEQCFARLPNQAVIAARKDAWDYMKSATHPLPPVLGSAMAVFSHAFAHAQVEGLVLEFGVRFGNSIKMLSRLAKQEVHGFDSFEGLPDEWHHEPKGSYSTKGVMPQVPAQVILHAGWFDNTLPLFLENHAGNVRLINIDCDIYSSTKTVLECLAPRIVTGTVIVFDEYIGNQHWREDEFKAFQEAVAKFGWQYEYLCFSFFTKQVAVRVINT